MKQILIITFLYLISTFSLKAQLSKQEKEDLIYSQKIAFITEKLQISPKEAQKFWPLYNEYWKKKNNLAEERKKITSMSNEELEALSEKESKTLANKYAEIRLKETQLFYDYNQKFQEVLPSKKVLLLFISDKEYKNYLLKKLKNSK